MKIIKVNNYIKYNNCPLCKGHEIYKIGNINYPSHINYYSNIKLNLTFNPELWKCNVCHSAFVQNCVSEQDSINFYSEDIGHGSGWINQSFEVQKHKKVVKKLTNLLHPDMKILDIGCCTGNFLDFAKQKDCLTSGVEYSYKCLEILREKGHIAYQNLESVEENFDLITGFDLIEHLYDVPRFLKLCSKLLKSTGKLIFLTGNISCFASQFTRSKWWYANFPQHIVFPAKEYFEMNNEFDLIDWMPTYAAASHNRSIIKIAKVILRELLNIRITGETFPYPDHALIILKKID